MLNEPLSNLHDPDHLFLLPFPLEEVHPRPQPFPDLRSRVGSDPAARDVVERKALGGVPGDRGERDEGIGEYSVTRNS